MSKDEGFGQLQEHGFPLSVVENWGDWFMRWIPWSSWKVSIFSIGRVFFARGSEWPRPKMVTNSFQKRNFMQPTGRPKHPLKVALLFFLLSLRAGREGTRIFFHFSLFPICSLWVPNGFLSGSQCVLHMLWQMLSFTCIGAPKGRNFILQKRTFFCFGESTWFDFLEWWANQIGLLELNRIELGRHLISIDHLSFKSISNGAQ